MAARPEAWLLGAILMAALIGRCWGLDYGSPYAFGNEDEFPVVRNAMSFGALRTLRPNFFNYPALQSYLIFAMFGLQFCIGKVAHIFSSAVDFALLFSIKPGVFHTIARIPSALLGTVTVALVYALGRRIHGAKTGVVAATLLTFSALHASKSHWALPDVPMTCLTTASLYFMWRHIEDGTRRWSILAGLALGLAISTKYNAGILIVPLILAHGFAARDAEPHGHMALATARRIVVPLVTVAAGFIAGSPYWLLDFSRYFTAFRYESNHMSVGHIGQTPIAPWLWCITDLIATEQVLGVALLCGIAYALVRRTRSDWLMLTHIALAFAVIGSWSKAGLYYLLPLWPPMCLLAARSLVDLQSRVARASARSVWALAALSAVVVAPSAVAIVREDLSLSRQDTRVDAKEWIEKNISVDSRIAMTYYAYCPPLLSHGGDLATIGTKKWSDPVFDAKLSAWLARQPTYHIDDLTVTAAAAPNGSDELYLASAAVRWQTPAELRARGIDYVILADWQYSRLLTGRPPREGTPLRRIFDARRANIQAVLSAPDLRLLHETRPRPGQPGPTIKIFKVLAHAG